MRKSGGKRRIALGRSRRDEDTEDNRKEGREKWSQTKGQVWVVESVLV
jgi:hypothetical protein